MTDTVFKVQAKRLAEHLARVHGVKLKHASILEAIAGLHGRPDWNTLTACGARELTAGLAPLALLETPADLRTSIQADQSLLGQWIRRAITEGHSDLYLTPRATEYSVISWRDGVRVEWHRGPLSEFFKMLIEVKQRAGVNTVAGDMQHGKFQLAQGTVPLTVRVTTVPILESQDPCILMRWTCPQTSSQTLASLGITRLADWRRGITQPGGLCLIGGVTGAGKSTTLAASANALVEFGRSVHVIDSDSGEELARAARADCDVLVFGDIRDCVSAQRAIDAASRGQLVLATVHATTPNGVMLRLRDMGVTDEHLKTLVKAVLVQKLVRCTCRACAGAGCDACHTSGYGGRTMVSECIVATGRQHILDRIGRDRTAPSMVDDAVAKCLEGVSDEREMARVFGTEVLDVLADIWTAG